MSSIFSRDEIIEMSSVIVYMARDMIGLTDEDVQDIMERVVSSWNCIEDSEENPDDWIGQHDESRFLLSDLLDEDVSDGGATPWSTWTELTYLV